MRALISIAAIAASFATPAFGDDARWIEIADTKASKLSIDPGSIKLVRASVRSAWLHVSFKQPRRAATSMVQLQRANCEEKSLAVVSTIMYDKNDAVVFSKSIPSLALSWEPAAPETTGERILKVLCDFDIN